MSKVSSILSKIGVSKVRLAKYLGVSRQMLYNYLSLGDINKWPKEKFAKLFTLLNVENYDELLNKEITGEYIIEVENRLNDGVKDSSDKEYVTDLKGFNKKVPTAMSKVRQTLIKRQVRSGAIFHPGQKMLKKNYQMISLRLVIILMFIYITF